MQQKTNDTEKKHAIKHTRMDVVILPPETAFWCLSEDIVLVVKIVP